MGTGVTQGLLWLSLDEFGQLRYSFVDIMTSMNPYYLLRLLAGIIFLLGAMLMAYNFVQTIIGRRTIAVRPPISSEAMA